LCEITVNKQKGIHPYLAMDMSNSFVFIFSSIHKVALMVLSKSKMGVVINTFLISRCKDNYICYTNIVKIFSMIIYFGVIIFCVE